MSDFVQPAITSDLGTVQAANPRRLLQLGQDTPDATNRPFEYASGPEGRVNIACQANYGHRAGSLIEIDPDTASLRVFRDRNAASSRPPPTTGLSTAERSIHGGRSSCVHALKATLFVLTPRTGKRVFEDPVVKNTRAIVAIRYNTVDQHVYATTDNQMLVQFNPRNVKVDKT